MVYYFTGTGNSRYVAKALSNLFSSELKFIPETDPKTQTYNKDKVIFVFPVYSWGVPPLVLKFVSELPDSFWTGIKLNQESVWCVMTCGDEVALAPEMIERILKEKGFEDIGCFSVIMPNNYVLLPGFDVDPAGLEKGKLEKVPKRILEITEKINSNSLITDVTRGKYRWLKSKIVYPLFKKWGINTTKWHYTEACISCGKCAKACPLKNVTMKEGHPVWDTRCCSCLACYHICPSHAVAYGKETVKKGQYWFPDLSK